MEEHPRDCRPETHEEAIAAGHRRRYDGGAGRARATEPAHGHAKSATAGTDRQSPAGLRRRERIHARGRRSPDGRSSPIFFGCFGAWAVTAPLNGAVVANAIVKVEGNRKSVQHLDGGIVKELRVKEGDRVAADDVLIVLDDTQARAELDVLSQQYLVLRATEERLRTELARQAEIGDAGGIQGARR